MKAHTRKVGDLVMVNGRKTRIREMLWTMRNTPVYFIKGFEWPFYEREVHDLKNED
jgi:hypothetical protein